MISEEKNPHTMPSSEQEKQIMKKVAEVLALEGLISPGEKATLFLHIRESAGL
ncbi:MAG: hypothetical protein Q4D16_01970 [Eubacteriales bacterium]|nr:hypothetical protein [Eubacteriales bacterium]